MRSVYLYKYLPILLLVLASAVATRVGHAHAVGENYVWLSIEKDRIVGEMEISFDDLNEKLDIDVSAYAQSKDEFATTHAEAVQAYVKPHFSINDKLGEYSIGFEKPEIRELPEATFLVLHFVATPPGDQVQQFLDIKHTMLRENDRLHRGLVLVKENKIRNETYDENTTLVYGPLSDVQTIDLENPPRLLSPLQFVWQGIIHILFGFDHVLFLITLLLTSVLYRVSRDQATADVNYHARWQPVSGFKEAFFNIFKIVTTFTIAHSITLALAATGLVELPGNFVEPIIALSIVLMALANFLPTNPFHRLGLIFFFGLFHGLGFATVMGELAFRVYHTKNLLFGVILTFNIGVEIGQLLIVALVFPLLYLLRKNRAYVSVVVYGLSIVVGLIGIWWFVERVTGSG